LNNRQLQALNTKNKIVDAAMKLSEKYGYEDMSIQMICEKAGISTGAFYHHFKGKQDLIVAGYSSCDDYFRENIFNNLEKKDIREKILEYLDFQMKYALIIGIDLMTQVYRVQITEGTSFFLDKQRELPKGLENLIEEAKNTGEIDKKVNVEAITDEILVISRGIIYNWCLHKGDFDLRKRCYDIMSKYLCAYF